MHTFIYFALIKAVYMQLKVPSSVIVTPVSQKTAEVTSMRHLDETPCDAGHEPVATISCTVRQ